MVLLSGNCYRMKKKDSLRTFFSFKEDCLRLSQCELIEPLPPEDLCQRSLETWTAESGCGTSVKECSEECLPLRKRKVIESDSKSETMLEVDLNDCHCVQKVSDNNDTENCDDSYKDGTVGDIDNSREAEHLFCECMNTSPNSRSQTMEEGMSQENASGNMIPQFIGQTQLDENSIDISLEKCSLESYNEKMKSRKQETLLHVADPVDIEYINDIDFNHRYCMALESYLSKHKGKKLSLLYVTPRLSLLGIQAAKLGFSSVTIATGMEHHEVIMQIAAVNRCRQGQITVMDMKDTKDCRQKYDVIVSDVVESYGALRQQALEDLIHYKYDSFIKCFLSKMCLLAINCGFIVTRWSLDYVSQLNPEIKFQVM